MKINLSRATSLGSFIGIGARQPKPTAEAPAAEDETEDAKRAREAEGRAAAAETRATEAEDRAVAAEQRAAEAEKQIQAQNDNEDCEGDDECDCADMASASAARAPRLRERARLAAILSHPTAQANRAVAHHLALKTDMPRSQACALLDAAPDRGTLADRMAPYAGQRPGPGGGGAPDNAQAVVASWDVAFGRVSAGRSAA